MNRILSILILFILSLSIKAQDNMPHEQILKSLEANVHDTIKIDHYIKSAHVYFHSNPDTAIYFCEKALALTRSNRKAEDQLFIDRSLQQAEILNKLGEIHFTKKGNHEKALQFHNSAMELWDIIQEEGGPSIEKRVIEGKALTHRHLSITNHRKGENDLAVKHSWEALRGYEKIQDSTGTALAYVLAGVLYIDQGDDKMAINLFKKALTIQKLINHRRGLAASYNNIGVIYLNQAKDTVRTTDPVMILAYLDSTEIYLEAARLLRVELNNYDGIAASHINLGAVFDIKSQIYADMGRREEASQYREQSATEAFAAYEVCKTFNMQSNLVLASANLCKNFFFRAQDETANPAGSKAKIRHFLDKSIMYGNEAMKLSRAMKSPNLIQGAAEALYNTYKQNRDFENAMAMKEIMYEYKDSLNSAETKAQLMEQKLIYQHEKEIEVLQTMQENKDLLAEQRIAHEETIIYWLFGGLLILLSLVIFIFNRLLYIKKQKHLIDIQREKYIKLNNIKDRLFSTISHDFKSPLNSLGSLLKLFNEGQINETQFKNFSLKMSQNIDETSLFLENLLKWAKNQMQTTSPKLEEFGIDDAIKTSLEVLEAQATLKHISIGEDLLANIKISADIEMIKLVIRNLITNALKYSPEKSHILVRSEAENGYVKVSVQDEGVGIPDNVKEKIFESEVESCLGTQRETGTGLGLMLSKQYIEQNNGSIGFTTEDGKGSTFFFKIPITKN